MNEQTRKPSSGTHMIDRNVLREDAKPCQRVRRAFRVRGAGEAAPAVFDAGDALCVLIRLVRAFLDSEQQGENRSRYGENAFRGYRERVGQKRNDPGDSRRAGARDGTVEHHAAKIH